MAKPRIFVSSTYYDLKHLRSSLENFVELIGYDPVLSEKGDIAFMPDAPLDESCYREVRNADIYVLIIGGRYGSQSSGENTKGAKDFFERFESITKLEYKAAAEYDIPIYILIEKSVYADYENFLKNKDNKDFQYAHVDSINIFSFIQEILSQPRNNPIYQFDRYSDIEIWLKEQWAGLFRELLKRLSDQAQIASLSDQVSELSEINQTLKRYLEAVMSKVVPKDSHRLIKAESERLEELDQSFRLKENPLMRHINGFAKLPFSYLYKALIREVDFDGFANRIRSKLKSKAALSELESLETRFSGPASRDYAEARRMLGLEAASSPVKRKRNRGG